MDKINEIKNYLQENDLDAAFITTPDNVFYVSGFRSEPHERLLGVMIFKEAEPFVICPLMEVPDLKASGWMFEAVGHQDTEDAWEVLAVCCREEKYSIEKHCNRKISFDGGAIGTYGAAIRRCCFPPS